MFSVQVFTLYITGLCMASPKTTLYPLYIGEIVGIAVTSSFAVLVLILLIVSIVYAVRLKVYKKRVLDFSVPEDTEVSLVTSVYFVSTYMHICYVLF